MNKIIEKEYFSEAVVRLVVEAPYIAKSRKAGHFVIVRVGDKGERIPLTIAAADLEKGTITLIVQKVGVSSIKLCNMEPGDNVTDIVGPLGQSTHIEKVGTVLASGGGVGIAPLLPIVEALKSAGNKVITVLAARTKDLIILEEQMRQHSDEVIIMTDDGSYGHHGFVTEVLQGILENEDVKMVVGIGPVPMMKFVTKITAEFKVKTLVSLNAIMVDGTGMCGCCRVSVGGQTRFACVDGPEFDGHQVDFDELTQRLDAYKEDEKRAYDKYTGHCMLE